MQKSKKDESLSVKRPEGVFIPEQTVQEILTVMRHAIYPNPNYLQINSIVTRLETALLERDSGSMTSAP